MTARDTGELNGWDEWRTFVLKELERTNRNIETLQGTISTLRENIAGLKVQASLWGGIAGAIPALMALAWALLTK